VRKVFILYVRSVILLSVAGGGDISGSASARMYGNLCRCDLACVYERLFSPDPSSYWTWKVAGQRSREEGVAAFIVIVPLHRGLSFVTRLPSSLWYCLSRYVDIVGSCLFCLFVFRLLVVTFGESWLYVIIGHLYELCVDVAHMRSRSVSTHWWIVLRMCCSDAGAVGVGSSVSAASR
jgi:hypothetical protein